MEVKVTRKYQVTIPEEIRARLGIKVGDKLVVKAEGKKVILEAFGRLPHPVEYLWSLSDRATDIDVVKLVEESWLKSQPKNIKQALRVTKEAESK